MTGGGEGGEELEGSGVCVVTGVGSIGGGGEEELGDLTSTDEDSGSGGTGEKEGRVEALAGAGVVEGAVVSGSEEDIIGSVVDTAAGVITTSTDDATVDCSRAEVE